MRIYSLLRWPKIQTAKLSVILLSLGALLLFLFFFLFGFFVSFPNTVLQNRVLAEINRQLPAGNRFESRGVSLGFPLRLEFDQARLIMDSALLPELTISQLIFSPSLATFIGTPGLSVYAESEFGSLNGTISRSREVSLHLRDGKFDLPIPEMSDVQVGGVITSVDLVGQTDMGKEDTLRFEAVVEQLLLTGADKFGLGQSELPLGNLDLEVAGLGRSLEIEQLSLEGGAIALTGSGKIVVQKPFEASGLDIKLSLRPESSADANLRTLLELLGPKEKDGSHTLQLRGRLLAPQLK